MKHLSFIFRHEKYGSLHKRLFQVYVLANDEFVFPNTLSLGVHLCHMEPKEVTLGLFSYTTRSDSNVYLVWPQCTL